MKKGISIILVFLMLFSTCSVLSFAEASETSNQYDLVKKYLTSEEGIKSIEETYSSKSDNDLLLLYLSLSLELARRNTPTFNAENTIDKASICYGVLISAKTFDEIATALSENTEGSKAPSQTEYSSGQGTFIVGVDLPAGTYDVVCESSSQQSYADSYSGLTDSYSSLYGDEYADMFGSISGMLDSLSGMYVTTYGTNGYMDQYLTLKVGESARIILTDGMKIEFDGGSAKLTFVR